MIPLKDDNPRANFPFVTVGFIVLNLIAFLYELQHGLAPVVQRYGAVPVNILQGRHLETLMTSMFLHGGFMHLGGNMLYLWIFGDNVENYLGHVRFAFFYLACGLIAAMAHIFSEAFFGGLTQVPMVGASGAVAGVLGAYVVKYPRARVLVLIPIFFFLTVRKIPALIVLGFWFVIQLLYGVSSIGSRGGGVAFWAHIGGFIAGIVLLNLFASRKKRTVYYW
ncbi:MAG: rhomboid family intramembrane serine protease [Calditrichaeota bacterium]|nr:MAG: rhomboid family intramembrane serine protease [Calditrichota bacterium]